MNLRHGPNCWQNKRDQEWSCGPGCGFANHALALTLERNAFRAYWTVMLARLVEQAEKREQFVAFHLGQVGRLAETHGDLFNTDDHWKTILAFAFDWRNTRGPS